MLSSIVLFMLIFIYGQMVAQSIAQEKTSKVMELPVSYTHLEAKEKQRGRKKITIAVLVSIALCIIAIFTALFLLPINIA